MRIYVGNLSYGVTEDELKAEFTAFGEVTSITIPMDRYSGQAKGFGFVEMPNKSEAEAAVAAMNGKNVKGRNLTVSEARPRTEGPRGERGGYAGGGGRGPGGKYDR